MLRYIARRLLELIPTTFGILVLTFVLFHVVGGSPALAVLGKNATKESIAAFNARYGYDKPLLVNTEKDASLFDSQFCNFVGNLAKGDFGGGVDALPLAAGFLTAFVTGCLACKFMIETVKRGKLIYFAIYCAVVGVVALVGTLLS